MNIDIGGKTYTYLTDIRYRPAVRRSYNDLAMETFHISFENWYQAGYWQAGYRPHVLMDGDRVIANISAEVMDCRLMGQSRRYVQLGAVMTDPAYRHRGLSRFLMEAILQEWAGRCDGVYLYANDTVREFYPKFGFLPAEEHLHTLSRSGGQGVGRKLRLDAPADLALFLRCARQGNPYAALTLTDYESLLMFYCSQDLKDCVIYLAEQDAVVIAEFEEPEPVIYELLGGGEAPLAELAGLAAPTGTGSVRLGFTPLDPAGLDCIPLREPDTTFFWHHSHPLPFPGPMRFPALSHT